jgi:hypothetical protein
MPKYLLLKRYRGGPEAHHPVPPMDQWAPEDVEAHMAFLRRVSELLPGVIDEPTRRPDEGARRGLGRDLIPRAPRT